MTASIPAAAVPSPLMAKLRELVGRDADMREYLDAVELAHDTGAHQRVPYYSGESFDAERTRWRDTVEDGEGAALCHNELSIARLCILNLLELEDKLSTGSLPMDHALGRRFVSGVLRQFVEEVEHAVAHCIDLHFDRPCRFKLFKRLANQALSTRLLAIITLEIREMSIRPRRLGDCDTAGCDLLALVDDVGHIQFGTQLLTAVIASGGTEPARDAIKEYLIEADGRHPERPPARCPELVVERLVNDATVRAWVYEADPVFGRVS